MAKSKKKTPKSPALVETVLFSAPFGVDNVINPLGEFNILRVTYFRVGKSGETDVQVELVRKDDSGSDVNVADISDDDDALGAVFLSFFHQNASRVHIK